ALPTRPRISPRRNGTRRFSPSPRLLPIPFGYHVLDPLAHLHAVMERGGVERAVGAVVVPAYQLAGLGAEHLVDDLEARRAAGLDIVEIGHEGPGALPGDRAELLEILPAGLEVVGVGLEFLPHRITLALHRLAVGGIDAVEREE